MLVITIIGFIVAIITVYSLVLWVNEYSVKRYRYEFFNFSNYLATAIGYGMIYFGEGWYREALANNQDILNGQVLIVIGFLLVVLVIYSNIKNTSFIFGVVMTVIQLALYAVLAVVGFYVLLAAMAFFSQTKPVYSINR
ncbi:hypothetical protein [Candidatus Sulfurimonas baltica]|uniref:Uncharacterized protein n=1 Tax=Candidatus Sulfurimonas baltica TaxID=2740404 RepID=A0A7S7RP79_9BACT|nr:hypothetical protein [Candidatus Sulfurimonas baltica]QOY53205.1 hypothetical protein HUE88_05870 [Candidatus Sulfurimonas baltica]